MSWNYSCSHASIPYYTTGKNSQQILWILESIKQWTLCSPSEMPDSYKKKSDYTNKKTCMHTAQPQVSKSLYFWGWTNMVSFRNSTKQWRQTIRFFEEKRKWVGKTAFYYWELYFQGNYRKKNDRMSSFERRNMYI